MNEKPLIWTTLGNLPIESLDYSAWWEESDEWIKFIEEYKLNGEVVKRSVHVKTKTGIPMVAEQANLG